ncbi:MAG: hypothetical protein GWN12_10310, partial [Thermoplasmata archaeon]|nr:hypothetical protein [Thermoplasmata archaeon]
MPTTAPDLNTSVITDPVENCTYCHTKTEMWYSGKDPDGSSGVSTSSVGPGWAQVSHYGKKRATQSGDGLNASAYGSTITNCSYCHQNASSFDLDPDHESVPVHPGNQSFRPPSALTYCTNSTCHGDAPVRNASDSSGFHSLSMQKPSLSVFDGGNSSYCERCHGGSAERDADSPANNTGLAAHNA